MPVARFDQAARLQNVDRVREADSREAMRDHHDREVTVESLDGLLHELLNRLLSAPWLLAIVMRPRCSITAR
ncbi:MAG TPA: hypothetical protein VMS64_35780 [Candidatus Methylomirabilis sp.]|nr:hypothetical protein [Candidatus Methylomirabilis sp.]